MEPVLRRFERVEEPLYYYYQHAVSTVHHITEEKCRDRMKAAELLYTECENRGFLAEYREQIEYRFTELYYVITLFSYLSGVEKPKLSFVKELREGTERHFPEFDRNKYYLEYTGPEERKFISMQKRAICGSISITGFGSLYGSYGPEGRPWGMRKMRLGK